jgi:hypothetical protein
VEAEDYLVLTDREEQDLEKLMSQCEFGISNAESFMENLAKDLSILDGVCIFYFIFKYLSDHLVVRVPGYRSRGPGPIPGATRFSEK